MTCSAVMVPCSVTTDHWPFASGFNRGDTVYGRPVDLLVLDDGSMLISDDQAGAIYRLSYSAAT